VTAIDAGAGKASLQYEDGDFSDQVRADEIRYAPSRPNLWGKGSLRGNNMIPDGAQTVVFPATSAASSNATRTLQMGDKVVAKYPPQRGRGDFPFFAATVTAIDAGAGKASLQYEDGDFSDQVRADEIRYAPNRPNLWGKGSLRGNNMIPDSAQTVVFSASNSNPST
jgi:hypothetical protein